MARNPALLALLGVLSGCALPHRMLRFVLPQVYVAPEPGKASGASVEVVGPDGEIVPYQGVPYRDGDLVRPVLVDERMRIRVEPTRGPVEVRIFARRTDHAPSAFAEVVALTGAREHELVYEVRPLPVQGARLEGAPAEIAVEDLANLYTGDPLRHQDLVLLQIEGDAGSDTYLFRNRRPGMGFRAAYEVAVRTPLTKGTDARRLSPAAMVGLQMAYRSRDGGKIATLALDQLALIGSVGIGTADLDVVTEIDGIEKTIDVLDYALLAGGGVKLFDVLSVQAITNVGAAARLDPTWFLGVGLDGQRLRAQTRDAKQRLLYGNELTEERGPETPDRRPPTEGGP